MNLITKAESVWQYIRKHHFQKRLYDYGEKALYLNDDRTIFEKLADKIDIYFRERRLRLQWESANKTKRFNSFFDWSLGVWIHSREDIKRIERERGMTYVSVKDWEAENARKHKRREEMRDKRIQKKLDGVIRDVAQGRKFTQESMERREAIFKKYGMKRI
jgi:hypothetical protein